MLQGRVIENVHRAPPARTITPRKAYDINDPLIFVGFLAPVAAENNEDGNYVAIAT
jgi:hypothetical protein